MRPRVSRHTVNKVSTTDRTIDQKIVSTYIKLWGIGQRAAWAVVKVAKEELHMARHKALFQLSCVTKQESVQTLEEVIWALERRIESELGETC